MVNAARTEGDEDEFTQLLKKRQEAALAGA